MLKDFLAINDFTKDELLQIFKLASDLKAKTKAGIAHPLLAGKTLAMIFQKPSARTRVSFETGMVQLGGHAIYLAPTDIGLGKRETPADVARVLSRYNDGIMARLFGHDLIVELAEYATVPVINGLTDFNHPCQVMADMMTIQEHLGRMEDFKIAYVGDGNNMVHSWLNAASRFSFDLTIVCPDGYDPDEAVVESTQKEGISNIQIVRDPMEGVKGADIIYTDVWASMGQEAEAEKRKKDFAGFEVNAAMVDATGQKTYVMHCLPAHRGEEISHEVMEAPYSIVFDEAENRLHIQKAILACFMNPGC